jgi:hypothetical protein
MVGFKGVNMEIVSNSYCTKILGAPADMPEPACQALPVMETKDEHGTWSVSFWKPSDLELAELNAGGCLTLWVRATDDDHPVVGLGTSSAPGVNGG